MSDLEIRMYAIARTQINPAIRIRWRGIGRCDWRNDLWPAHLEMSGAVLIPGQLIGAEGDTDA